MSPKEYQELALRSQADQTKILERLVTLGPKTMQLDNAVRGLADDCGELNGCVKKHIEYGQGLDSVNFKEEVGDILWRLAQACDAVGITLEDCMISNIQKLKVRYPSGYSDFHAAEENRDRQAEAEAVNLAKASNLDLVSVETNLTVEDIAYTSSFGDGVGVKQLSHSYDRFCCSCRRVPIHRLSESLLCPDCGADIRAGRKACPEGVTINKD